MLEQYCEVFLSCMPYMKESVKTDARRSSYKARLWSDVASCLDV